MHHCWVGVRRASKALAPYGLALAMLCFATSVTVLLWPHNERSPFALFYLAIIVAAGFGGTRAGVLTLIGSGLTVNYCFLPARLRA